ncbi:DegT/DnrJ/EryC1/StrS family aminotransferase [Desulfonema magnum]|uniref:DegT/DnrJ/EryC1/StrS aminotransferase domain-containing protein n=1 Tax=Desulfonema magnum TaxID=45655 RepID=A0A975BPY9_9BACT|nr:DegT/DnrJ/EryC1/StrS family aminotransferase [Desulfonema magnum]QTA88930.1 DegT/DnrJ/EryC1/StrS aminotransferase domain-containing protein [Desulfonema magnum]
MQFIDLAAQQQRIRTKIEANIKAVLDHGQYVMGPEIKELEDRLSAYTGVKHAIACSSGTDALLMALMAYDVGPGDAVFTTPFTFIATAEVISLLGATPVFWDIDPKTFNLETGNWKLETGNAELTPKGIIGVDLFGLPADYNSINTIAQKHGLFVIEDAAQSFGAEYHGRKACSLADVACTSFFPAKPLGCYGDGGAVFTDNDELAEKMISIRIHGQSSHKYDNARIGINGRIDAIQAAILLAKLDIFPEETELRQQVAQRYTDGIRSYFPADDQGQALLIPPSLPDGMKSVWAQYSILAQDEQHRAAIQAKLGAAEIPTAIYYPRPLHLQPAFEYLGYKQGDFPISEDFSRRIFSLPMHPYLTREEQERIVEILAAGVKEPNYREIG